MPRPDLDSHFVKIDQLILDIDAHVPPSTGYAAVKLRADLAGLLVVTMAATYETCVKEVIHGYANRVHRKFGNFTAENFKKINSKVNINDLNHYCNLFDPNINQRFNSLLAKKKQQCFVGPARTSKIAISRSFVGDMGLHTPGLEMQLSKTSCGLIEPGNEFFTCLIKLLADSSFTYPLCVYLRYSPDSDRI